MKIADLFVNLGIKGNGEALKGIKSVDKGMADLKSMSLEAKAAIIAAFYALQQTVSISNKAGTGLLNFATTTGLSAKSLQQWEYAARQAGVSSDEVMSSFKGLNAAMMEMKLHGNAPAGMGIVAKTVGDFDFNKIQDTFYVMQKLQEFAKKTPNAAFANNVLSTFGLSEGTKAALMRGAFTPGAMKNAPSYSDREIMQLNKADAAWMNLSSKIQMAIGHLNAKHGLQLVQDISKLTTEMFKLINALIVFSEKAQVFDHLGKVFENLTNLTTNVTGIFEAVTGGDKGALKEMAKSVLSNRVVNGAMAGGADIASGFIELSQSARNAGQMAKPANNINVNLNQSFNHDGVDHTKAGDAAHSGIKKAFNQLPARVIGQ